MFLFMIFVVSWTLLGIFLFLFCYNEIYNSYFYEIYFLSQNSGTTVTLSNNFACSYVRLRPRTFAPIKKIPFPNFFKTPLNWRHLWNYMPCFAVGGSTYDPLDERVIAQNDNIFLFLMMLYHKTFSDCKCFDYRFIFFKELHFSLNDTVSDSAFGERPIMIQLIHNLVRLIFWPRNQTATQMTTTKCNQSRHY